MGRYTIIDDEDFSNHDEGVALNIRSGARAAAQVLTPLKMRGAGMVIAALSLAAALPAQAALSFSYTVAIHNEALKNSSNVPPDSVVSNVAALGEHYQSVVSPVRGELIDFDKRARYVTDEKNKTYTAFSLYDTVGFRVMEQQNRLAMGKSLAAAKIDAMASDPLFDENILSVQGAPRTLAQAPDAANTGTEFSIDGKLLARASGGVDVSAADAALFARFLRYQVGGHPLVLAQLVQMHRVPAKLVFFYRQAASTQEVTLSFAAVKASAPAALPLQGYARHMSDGDGLAALLDRAAIAPVPAAGEIRKALGEEAAAAFTDLRALDALLATLEMNLSTGDEPQPFTPAQKAAIELDPSVKELLRALSLKERTDLPEAVATLQALRPKTMRRQYMLKLFEANDRAILGENKAAIELLTGVVHASPGLAGAYKDLGDKLFGAFDMAGAWRCWDAGRRIAPGLKLFDQVNRFEAELLKRHPEYF